MPLPAMFITSWKAELNHASHTILHGMADLTFAVLAMHRAAGKREDCSGLKVKELYSFLHKALPGKKELKEKKDHTLWNPIFDHAKSLQDKENRNERIHRYSSTKRLFNRPPGVCGRSRV